MTFSVKLEGYEGLKEALEELKTSTARAVVRRSLVAAAKPLVDDFSTSAPRLTGALQLSAGVGTRLTRRQARLHRRMFRGDRAGVEVFAGFNNAAAVPQEFGYRGQPPKGFARAAWLRQRYRVFNGLAVEMRRELDAAAKRAARKAARLARKALAASN